MFVCVENACRGQMAEGIFNALTDKAVAKSAGTEIAKRINLVAIEVMKKREDIMKVEEVKTAGTQMTKILFCGIRSFLLTPHAI